MHRRYHRRTLQPHRAISALLQVPLQHMPVGIRFRILLQRHSLPYRTAIKWRLPIKRQHGLLLPWGTARHRGPHRLLHRRASLSGSRAPSATTKSDILLQGLIVCERIYLSDETFETYPVHPYVQMAPYSNQSW